MKSFTGVGYSIYKHTNRFNGKCYIGQTKCEDLTRRWGGGNGYKGCNFFYSAILKYGWKSFAHEILETGLTAEQANDREQFYIALYRSDDPEFGYNVRGETKEIIRTYRSIGDAALDIGCCPCSIGNAIRRNGRSAGYYWRFAETTTMP